MRPESALLLATACAADTAPCGSPQLTPREAALWLLLLYVLPCGVAYGTHVRERRLWAACEAARQQRASSQRGSDVLLSSLNSLGSSSFELEGSHSLAKPSMSSTTPSLMAPSMPEAAAAVPAQALPQVRAEPTAAEPSASAPAGPGPEQAQAEAAEVGSDGRGSGSGGRPGRSCFYRSRLHRRTVCAKVGRLPLPPRTAALGHCLCHLHLPALCRPSPLPACWGLPSPACWGAAHVATPLPPCPTRPGHTSFSPRRSSTTPARTRSTRPRPGRAWSGA